MGVRIVHSGCGYVSIPRGDQTYLRLLLAAGDRLVPTKPLNKALIHSDQGSQFTSMDWSSFLRTYNLEHSMNQRGNCHDNVVAESFFKADQGERIRRRSYEPLADARQNMFDYIEIFYNPKRKQARTTRLISGVKFGVWL